MILLVEYIQSTEREVHLDSHIASQDRKKIEREFMIILVEVSENIRIETQGISNPYVDFESQY